MTPGSRACTICRCGDATFNALGEAGYTTAGWRSALDWERFDKDEGNPAQGMESQVENRVTLFASYGFSPRFMVSARVPYSHRELTETEDGATEAIATDGLSDPEVFAQVQVWGSAMSELGQSESLSLVAGVKTPWGENELKQGGERVDEHAQPGTGATDLFASAAFLHLMSPVSTAFLSVGYRHTGTNDYGYRYGSTFTANAAYEHKLGVFDSVLELNYRYAEKDRLNDQGGLGENTGGSLLYVTPRALVDLGRGAVLRAGVQIPLLKDLGGEQTERVVVNVGLTYLFSHM
jgi:hypothetical protein